MCHSTLYMSETRRLLRIGRLGASYGTHPARAPSRWRVVEDTITSWPPAMFHLIHRVKACHKQAACLSTTAALDMQAVELSEVRTTIAPHRRRLSMYSRIPSCASGAANRANSFVQLLAQALLLSARCCFAATAMVLLYWLLYAGPLHWRIELGYIIPTAAKALYESKVLGSMLLRDLVFMWLVPTAIALSAVAVLVLQPVARQQQGLSAMSASIGSWMSRLIPPRALWQWLCGGITVQDLLLICCWTAINISWFTAALAYYQRKAMMKAAANGLASATGQQVVKAVARSFGASLAPNLVLLFYPVSRGSVVLQLLGVSYPAGIRYHRWLGYGVMSLVALHGLSYHTVWLASGEWSAKALEQGSGHNNLLGSVAFVFALALWVTSLETVRRTHYDVFKAVHHIGFWGFLVFGVCHKWDLIWAFLPGLLLYAIDAVYRVHQAVLEPRSGTGTGSTTRVLHASVSPCGGLCTLVLSSPVYAAAGSGYLWLSVPSLSWQFHPFEYIAVPWPDDATPAGPGSTTTALLLHIKAYSRFTKQLLSLVAAKGEKIAVKIQGPYCELPAPVLGHGEAQTASSHTCDGIVIVAGGNGISSAAGVFKELAAAAVTPGLPCLLIWASRSAEELEVMGPWVLAMARVLRLQLTLRLYYTGTIPAATSLGQRSLDGLSLLRDAPSDHATLLDHVTLLGAAAVSPRSVATALPSGAPAGNLVISSPYEQSKPANCHNIDSLSSGSVDLPTSSLCPVVALGSWWGQAGHKLAMHIMAAAGMLCALALAQHIQDTQTAVLGSRWPTAKAGATYTVLLAACVFIAGAFTLWATLLFSRLLSKRSAANGHGSCSTHHVDVEVAAATAGSSSGSCVMVNAVASAAAAAAMHGSGALILARNAGLQLHLPAVQAHCRDICVGSSVDDTRSIETVQLLQQPSGLAWPGSALVPVESGRPPLCTLVKAWLATLQQLAGPEHSSSRRRSFNQHCCLVYAMGPEQLVQQVQQLCDDVSGLRFVRKTHQL